MAIRAKTKRRLLILILGVLVLMGSGASIYVVRKNQIRNQALAERQQGMALMATEDYFGAIHPLRRYLRFQPDDVEALYAFSQARQKIVEPKARHLIQAKDTLRLVLEHDPNHKAAQYDLLELYGKLGFVSEAQILAESLLAKNDRDAVALKAKTTSLVRLRKFKDAEGSIKRYNELKPNDLQGQMLRLSIIKGLGQPLESTIERAQALHQQDPDDPRFQLLLAMAHLSAHHVPEATKWCRTAAKGDVSDPGFITMLVDSMTRLYLFDESLEILLRNGAAQTPELQLVLIRRLWQENKLADVVERLKDLDSNDRTIDIEVLALKALSLLQLKRDGEAAPIIAGFERRIHDENAESWARVLKGVFSSPRLPNQKIVETCRTGLSIQPNNPYFHYFLGAVHASAAEHELALKQWVAAMNAAPSWSTPSVQATRSLLASNKPILALKLADMTRKRWPKNIDVAIVFVEAWDASQTDQQTAQTAEQASVILELVERIQKYVPGEERTLPIRIRLLARLGKVESARESLLAFLEVTASPNAKTLMRLAQVSREEKLDLEDQCIRRYEQQFGMSAELATSQAIQLAAQGKSAEGLHFLDEARARNSASNSLPWHLARARFLEVSKHADAKDAWIKLTEDFPDNRHVLNLAIHATSTWADMQFIDQAIKGLVKLRGNDNPRIRMARARWLLASDGSKENAAKAIDILNSVINDAPHLVQPRITLARALEKQGNISAAVEHLSTAATMSKQPILIRLEQARLAQSQGDFDSALTVLDHLIRDDEIDQDQKHTIAAMLAQQGKIEPAIDLLLSLYQGNTAPPDLLLANLYLKQNQYDKVEAISQALLQDHPDIKSIEFAAHFFASRGRKDEAQKILAYLDHLDTPDSIRELVRGAFFAKFMGPDEAIPALHAAVKADPTMSQAQVKLIQYLLAFGRIDEAIKAIKQAAIVLPDHIDLAFISEHIDLLPIVQKHVQYRPLAIAMIVDRIHQPAALEALSMIHDAHLQDMALKDVVTRLSRIADAQPRFLPIQILTASFYLRLNLPNEAAGYATRATQAFPNAIEPARIACQALTAAGRWPEVLAMTDEWQRRSTERSTEADLMTAVAKIQLNHADEAVQLLEPHMTQAMQDPDAHSAVILGHTRALIASGQTDRAAEILIPLLSKSVGWRLSWIRLVAFSDMMDETTSVDWLTRVSIMINPDAMTLWVTLAQAWYNVGTRTGNSRHFDAAYDILKPLTTSPDVPRDAWLIIAMIDDARGKIEAAKHSYRMVLQLKPDHLIALNNLAMLHVIADHDLTEATSLASKAVAAAPQNADYRETLARIYSKSAKHEEALEQIDVAINQDPVNVEWRIRKVKILLTAGRNLDAKTDLDTIIANTGNQGSTVQQRRLAQLREMIDSDTSINQPLQTP